MSDERKDDGGPAFPGDYDVVLVDLSDKRPPQKIAARQSGMSLRDYFAGQALAGLVPNVARDYSSGPFCNEEAAKRCYAIADAMLAVRKAGER